MGKRLSEAARELLGKLADPEVGGIVPGPELREAVAELAAARLVEWQVRLTERGERAVQRQRRRGYGNAIHEE